MNVTRLEMKVALEVEVAAIVDHAVYFPEASRMSLGRITNNQHTPCCTVNVLKKAYLLDAPPTET